MWFDMANILNEPDVDQSYYKVFRDLLDAALVRAAKGFPSSPISLQNEVSLLGKNVDLRTGVCMSAIWEAARPAVPTTLETWIVYDEVSSVIAHFERDTAFQMGIAVRPFI